MKRWDATLFLRGNLVTYEEFDRKDQALKQVTEWRRKRGGAIPLEADIFLYDNKEDKEWHVDLDGKLVEM